MRPGALLFKADGGVHSVTPANGWDFSLEELQGMVDGLIEIIDIRPGIIMVVNEDCKERLERNAMATVLAKAHGAIFPNDYIAGDALMCPSELVK